MGKINFSDFVYFDNCLCFFYNEGDLSFFHSFFMQSLLIAEDFHHGKFVQQGFKYESIPMELLQSHAGTESLTNALTGCDSVFLLMRDKDALEKLLSVLESLGQSIPVIVLAEHYDAKFPVYLRTKKVHRVFTRPFPFRSIAAEIRILVYSMKEQSEFPVLKVRDLELRRDTHEVVWKGRSIRLRHKEFTLLEFMMLNSGKLLSREKILESVWDRNANIFTNTVDVHINKLRKKIDYSVSDKFIHTVHCSGYIFS